MKIFLIIYGILIFIIFAEPIFEDVFNLATIVGCGYGASIMLCGIFWNSLSFDYKKYIAFFVIVISFALYLPMNLINRGGRKTADDQKVLIVLGCSVKWDKPSLSLIKRVDAAYLFLLSNPESVAILSGGQGRDEAISEAECMYNMLVYKGISKDRLFIEDKSTTTNQNIKYSIKILKQNHLTNEVAIATSEYHQLRAGMIAKHYGLIPYAQPSKTKPSILPTFLLREVFAIIKTKLGI